MKADYNSIFYTYEATQKTIFDILSDIALEADTPDEIKASAAVADTVKSDETKAVQNTNLINKIIERVKKLIRVIISAFDAMKRKLSNRLRLMMESDKGFYTLYYKNKSMIKPLKNVQVISYQYIDQVLDGPMNKLLSEIVLTLDKLRAIEGTSNNNARISDIIAAPQEKTLEVLFSPYIDKGQQISSASEFIKYIVGRYRGEKKTIVYNDTQLPQIEARALSTKKLSAIFNGYLRTAGEAANKVKVLENQIRRHSQSEKEINIIAKNAAKASMLYNTYSALVHAYYEIKLEQSLNYRIILKKFYQF